MTKKKRDLKALLPDEVVDKMLSGCEKPEDILGEDGLLSVLTKRLVERALGADLTHHLGYETRQKQEESTNGLKGVSPRILVSEGKSLVGFGHY